MLTQEELSLPQATNAAMIGERSNELRLGTFGGRSSSYTLLSFHLYHFHGNDNNKPEMASLAVAIVALVVALVALLGTTAQVFQQYLATAAGYSNCGKRVMGPWARNTKLVFHPWEL
ncbi:hypothetical protein QBC43DRAFT_329520 [Cladorrhinum sp. PSN259]|nr:hypothetical protein QBC43DRAFT_329520 [Cladorrhinum sp. PSN259]